MPGITNQSTVITEVEVTIVADTSDETVESLSLLERLVEKMRLMLTHLSLMTDHELDETDVLEE